VFSVTVKLTRHKTAYFSVTTFFIIIWLICVWIGRNYQKTSAVFTHQKVHWPYNNLFCSDRKEGRYARRINLAISKNADKNWMVTKNVTRYLAVNACGRRVTLWKCEWEGATRKSRLHVREVVEDGWAEGGAKDASVLSPTLLNVPRFSKPGTFQNTYYINKCC